MKIFQSPILYFFILILNVACNSTNTNEKKSEEICIATKHSFYSKALGENRILNIYLPPNYSPDSGQYPVVYLLDGGVDEDLLHVVGLFQISSAEWIRRVQASIIVGIENIDRVRDFTFMSSFKDEREKFASSGHSDKFTTFLCKELVPFINQHYRTSKERTLIGESLGGLMATQIILSNTGTFNKYVVISPSLWWDDGSIFNHDFKSIDSAAQNNTKVFIAVGKEGSTDGPRPHIMEVDAERLYQTMMQQNYQNIKTTFKYIEDEDHATIGHIALYQAIRAFSKSQ